MRVHIDSDNNKVMGNNNVLKSADMVSVRQTWMITAQSSKFTNPDKTIELVEFHAKDAGAVV